MTTRTFFIDQPRGVGGPLAVYGLSAQSRYVVPRPILSLPPTDQAGSLSGLLGLLLEVMTTEPVPAGITGSSRVREVTIAELETVLFKHFRLLFNDAEATELTVAAHERIVRDDDDFVRSAN